GECLILDTSESPRDAVECTLSAILEPHVHTRFYLSPKAAAGILRRAEKREKELPPRLREGLEAVAAGESRQAAGKTSQLPSPQPTEAVEEGATRLLSSQEPSTHDMDQDATANNGQTQERTS